MLTGRPNTLSLRTRIWHSWGRGSLIVILILGVVYSPRPQSAWAQTEIQCPGAPVSKIQAGQRGFISLDPPSPSRVRELPGTQGRIRGQMQPGAVFLVLGGPRCSDNYSWWMIRAESGDLQGWVAEGDFGAYWIVVCPGQARGSDCQIPSVDRGPALSDLSLAAVNVRPDGAIVFADEQGAVWLKSSADAPPQPLMDGSQGTSSAQASPDGRWLAVSRYARDALHASLWLVDLTTRESRLVSDNHTRGLSWSPDSRVLAYDRAIEVDTCLGGPWPDADGIWGLTIETGATELLVPAKAGYPLLFPQWSPDGTTLLFNQIQYCEGNGPYGYWTVADSQYHDSGSVLGSLDWSPDAQWIVYDTVSYGGSPAPNLWIQRLDGRDSRVLPSSGGYLESQPRWSPDGRHLLFARSSDEFGDAELWRFDWEAGPARLSDTRLGAYDWSPSGAAVAFSTQDGLLYTVSVDGSGLRPWGRGALLDWLPSGSAQDTLARLIEQKRGLIQTLKSTDAIVGYGVVRLSLTAFQEQSSLELIDTLAAAPVSDAQAAAFERLVLQEQTLAKTLGDYSVLSGYQADAAADVTGMFWGTAFMLATSQVSAARAAADVERKMFRDVVVAVSSRLPDGPVRTLFTSGISAAMDLYQAQSDNGATAFQVLAESTVRGTLARRNLQLLVDRVEPTIDQGVRSVRGTGDPRWDVQGTVASARSQTDGVVYISGLQRTNATNWHEGLDRGRQVNEIFKDMADLLGTTGTGWYFRVAQVWFRVEQVLIDFTEGSYIVAPAMSCVLDLSERTGSLAFNPGQPVATCRVPGASRSPGRAETTAPLSLGLLGPQLQQDLAAYRNAVDSVRTAVQSGDSAALEPALQTLVTAQEALNPMTSAALMLAAPAETGAIGESVVRDVLNLDGAAVQLLLDIAAVQDEPSAAEPRQNLEEAIDQVLQNVDSLDGSLAAQVGVGGASGGLAIFTSVPAQAEATVGTPAVITVRVRNAGDLDLSGIQVAVSLDGVAQAPQVIESLEAGAEVDVTVPVAATRVGRQSVAFELASGGHVDVAYLVLEALSAPQNQAQPTQAPGATGIPCLSGAAMALAVLGFVRQRWTTRSK